MGLNLATLIKFSTFSTFSTFFSKKFDKSENNLICAKLEKVLWYVTIHYYFTFNIGFFFPSTSPIKLKLGLEKVGNY
jgi:hypothetical protein